MQQLPMTREVLDTNILLPGPRPWILSVYTGNQFSGVPAYRWMIPYREMQRRGYIADWAQVDQLRGWTASGIAGGPDRYDIYVLQHALFPYEWLSQAHKQGKKTVGDMDDDYTEREHTVNAKQVAGAIWDQVRHQTAMTVSTEEVKRLVCEYGGRDPDTVFVCPNLMDLTIWQNWERAPAPTIGLSGGFSHEKDWRVVPDVVRRILSEYPEWHFLLVGSVFDYLRPLLREFPSRVHAVEGWLPYNEYPGMITKMDIGLCPVDPGDSFNRYKSPIKALELMCASNVPVCSRDTIYDDVIDGKNGILVDHSSEGFYHGVRRAIEDYRTMGKLGHAYVSENWDVRKRYTEWRSAYEQIAKL